jgi:hypothetical protein
LALIAAIGTSVALPAWSLIIAGPLAAALAGAGAGVTGGLVGALVGSGIPGSTLLVRNGIKNGGIVMGVKPGNEEMPNYFEEVPSPQR